MRRTAIGVAALMMIFGSDAGSEEVRTVQEMLQDCDAELNSPAALLCGGVVEGMAQVLIWNCVSRVYGWEPDPGLVAGVPPSIGAAVEAFVDRARSHPEELGEEWQLGLAAALAETFPCPH